MADLCCNVCGCQQPIWSKGMCKKHYTQDYDKKRYALEKEQIKARTKEYYILHRDAMLENMRIYRDKPENKTRHKIKHQLWWEANKEQQLKRMNDYYYAHKAEIDYKELYQKKKIKMLNNPELSIYNSLAALIRQSLKYQGEKSCRTMELVGCSKTELRQHLEKQFTLGMCWQNYGKVWHIDHIIPRYAFLLNELEQQKLCFHYTNLQPMFANENIKKSCSMENVEMEECVLNTC